MKPSDSPFFDAPFDQGRVIELFETPNLKSRDYSIHFPAMVNAHSHAFQFAMAGQAEYFSGESDNFWTWRSKMYDLANSITPVYFQEIAEKCYRSLKSRGYGVVCEFLYLHFFDGSSRSSLSTEMAESLISAAKNSDIELCLVPVYYNQGGFGEAPLEKQKNFCFDSLTHYLEYIEKLDQLCKNRSVKLGWGLHSLRAATPKDAADLLTLSLKYPNRPFHLHISEQIAEVEQSVKFLGARPVEWLQSILTLGQQHNLVHATHLTESELSFLANSQATVVLCPTTEASLGDGVFPFFDFVKQGGKFAIGSDSQIGLSPFEELRWLDYQSRLARRSRNLFGDTGTFQARWLWQNALKNARKAAGLFSTGTENSCHSGFTIQAFLEDFPHHAKKDEQFSRFFYQR